MKKIEFMKTPNNVFTDFKHYKTVEIDNEISHFYHATKTYRNVHTERVSVEIVNDKIRSWQS